MSHGPMPAAVYWRRRLIIAALLIAGVWLVLRFTTGDDGSSPTSTATSTPKAPPVVVPTNGAFEVSLAADTRACDPQKVRITPTISSDQTVGVAVGINLVISSVEKAPCTLKPADADLIAVISANGTAVWDSTLCSSSLLTDPVQLAGGGWATVSPTTWSGRGSGGACTGKEGYASPGRYTVQIGTLGGEPGEASFALKAAPKKTPKKTPTKTTKTPKTPATPQPTKKSP